MRPILTTSENGNWCAGALGVGTWSRGLGIASPVPVPCS